jgi:hypothetical protein
MTEQTFILSNNSLRCVGIMVPKRRITTLPSALAQGQLPILSASYSRDVLSLAYYNYAETYPDELPNRQFIALYAPQTLPLRVLYSNGSRFWLEHCNGCHKRITSTCNVPPTKFVAGGCPIGHRVVETITRVESDFPWLAVHVIHDRSYVRGVRLLTPVESSEDLKYSVFRALYTGHTGSNGDMCTGSSFSSDMLNQATNNTTIVRYPVAEYLQRWLTSVFKAREMYIPGDVRQEDWLRNLATNQQRLNADNSHQNEDLHLFEFEPDGCFSTNDTDPFKAVYTSVGSSRLILATNNQIYQYNKDN